MRGVVRQKAEIAGMLGVPLASVQVVALDIGGNFGTKNSIFPNSRCALRPRGASDGPSSGPASAAKRF